MAKVAFRKIQRKQKDFAEIPCESSRSVTLMGKPGRRLLCFPLQNGHRVGNRHSQA
jgi:hypothetical protein